MSILKRIVILFAFVIFFSQPILRAEEAPVLLQNPYPENPEPVQAVTPYSLIDQPAAAVFAVPLIPPSTADFLQDNPSLSSVDPNLAVDQIDPAPPVSSVIVPISLSASSDVQYGEPIQIEESLNPELELTPPVFYAPDAYVPKSNVFSGNASASIGVGVVVSPVSSTGTTQSSVSPQQNSIDLGIAAAQALAWRLSQSPSDSQSQNYVPKAGSEKDQKARKEQLFPIKKQNDDHNRSVSKSHFSHLILKPSWQAKQND